MTVWLTQAEAGALFPMAKYPVDKLVRQLSDTPGSKIATECILRAITSPSWSTTKNLIVAWIETSESPPERSEHFAFCNDNEKSIARNVTDALRNYGMTSAGRSQRDQIRRRSVV